MYDLDVVCVLLNLGSEKTAKTNLVLLLPGELDVVYLFDEMPQRRITKRS